MSGNEYGGLEYKPSYYNFFYERDTISLLYNTYTHATAKLNFSDKNTVLTLLDNPNNIELRKNNPSIWHTMLGGGFVVDKSINEMEFIKFRILKHRFNVNQLTIVLLPTRACNFCCVYCFEDSNSASMNREDCNEAIQFIKSQIVEYRPSALGVLWYGGEPLLVPDTMEYLSKELICVCKELNTLYAAYLVSNGFMLTELLAHRLKDMKIRSVTITLDGPEEIHNQRRISKDGRPTFQRIKEAILIAKRTFENIAVRIHIDKENSDSIEDFLKEEWLQGENVFLRAGWLRDFSDSCVDWKLDQKGASPSDFHKMEGLFAQTIEARAGVEIDYKGLIKSIPAKGSHCGADHLGTWIIGPGALVYKCASALDSNDECGYLNNGKFYPNQNFLNWFLNNPIDNEICRQCKLLPMCMGGCPILMKSYAAPPASGICDYWSCFLEERIKLIIQKIRERSEGCSTSKI
ncbi:radical SAM protein [Candidatus Bathyarchaeota archaeon]|nr:radical SAM protein [Candidatus Bathyarchaeota archaeon]